MKKTSEKELNDVSGGKSTSTLNMECPKCKHSGSEDSFISYSEGTGCSRHSRFKCPNCNHEWKD